MEPKMLKYIYFFSIILVVLTEYCLSSEQRHSGSYNYGTCPSEESKFREFIKISIRECVRNCALRSWSKLAGYNRRYKTCSLHFRTSEEEASHDNPECVQIQMDTADISKLSGGCNCGRLFMCGDVTGACVMKDLTNIALQKPTELSFTFRTAVSSCGVDGNTNQDNVAGKSCFHTKKENSTWCRVDLEDLIFINYTRLYNRLDQNQHVRAHDISIEVGKTLDTMKEVATIPGDVPGIEEVHMPIVTYARYFKITLKSNDTASVDILHLCEDEIFGYTDKQVIYSTSLFYNSGLNVIYCFILK